MRKLKLYLKRTMRFCSRGGIKYISLAGIIYAIQWQLHNRIMPETHKKIIWLGPFSPIHANVGDHAQTLAVWKFLHENFADYKIIRIYRDDITEQRLSKIAQALHGEDLIFIHSSGDFGSLHDIKNPHTGRMSQQELRRKICELAPTNKIINLPTTAYYESTEKGHESLIKDRKAFNNCNLTILCRENESLQIVKDNLSCESMFFPDFVFYLQPENLDIKRKGALVILRNDKEAVLSPKQKQLLLNDIESHYKEVEVKDVMHESFVIPDFIQERYFSNVLIQFQKREMVITDKMHGMITAVITHTPCIALSGGIPHKISAYKSFLSGAVEFVEDVSEVETAIQKFRMNKYKNVNLNNYFKRFRNDVAGV